MTRHARTTHRLTAPVLWAASVAWGIWGPDADGVHRTILSGAVAATIIAALDVRLVDTQETARLTMNACLRQSQVDRVVER